MNAEKQLHFDFESVHVCYSGRSLTKGNHFSSYIYIHNIYHAKSRLNTPVWGSLRSPNYFALLRPSRLSSTVIVSP